MNSRNVVLDTAKALGIILVVLGHSWLVLNQPGLLFDVIYSFHVPLFFFISGVFIKENTSYKEFLVKKTDSILKPYFTISILLLIYATVKSEILNGSFLEVEQYLSLIIASGSSIVLTPIWFLPSLYISLIMALLLANITKNNPMFLLFISLFLICIVFFFNSIHSIILDTAYQDADHPDFLPWSIDLLPITLLFTFSGYVLRDYVTNFKPNILLFLINTLFFIVFIKYNFTHVNLHARSFEIPIIMLVQAFMGIYITLYCSYYLNKVKSLQVIFFKIGSHTLFILIFHGLMLNFLTRNINKVIDNMYFSSLLGVILSIVISILIYRIIKQKNMLNVLFLPFPLTKK